MTQEIQLFHTEREAVEQLAVRQASRNALTLVGHGKTALATMVRQDYFDAFNAGVVGLLRKIARAHDPEEGTFSLTFGDGHKLEIIASRDGFTSATVNGKPVLSDRHANREELLVHDGEWLRAAIKNYADQLAQAESEQRRADLLEREAALDRVLKPY